MPIGVDSITQAIKLNGVAISFNIQAFLLGRLYAVDPDQVISMAEAAYPKENTLPVTLAEVIAHRSQHLVTYQNNALSDQYRGLVERVRRCEDAVVPGNDKLALAVAHNYAKLLAYKDEYEVARLLSSPELRAEIDRMFNDGWRIALNIAPPIVYAGTINGRPKKREFGSWILPVMKVIARLRGLRGTAFDQFGRTSERRMERSLITEYEQLVELIMNMLTPENYAQATAILELADGIRGYGQVKEASVIDYHAKLSAAKKHYKYLSPP